MASRRLVNWPDIPDLRPVVKKDTFCGKEFEMAVNRNRELYTGFSNKEEVRKMIEQCFDSVVNKK